MIAGIGIDLVHLPRIQGLLERHSTRCVVANKLPLSVGSQRLSYFPRQCVDIVYMRNKLTNFALSFVLYQILAAHLPRV